MTNSKGITTKQIGDLIRKTRKAQHLRQDELAGVASVGIRFIVELEAGKPTIQLEKTLLVLSALGCGLSITLPPGMDSLPPSKTLRSHR